MKIIAEPTHPQNETYRYIKSSKNSIQHGVSTQNERCQDEADSVSKSNSIQKKMKVSEHPRGRIYMTLRCIGREGRKAESGRGARGAGVQGNGEEHLYEAGLQIGGVLQNKPS